MIKMRNHKAMKLFGKRLWMVSLILLIELTMILNIWIYRLYLIYNPNVITVVTNVHFLIRLNSKWMR